MYEAIQYQDLAFSSIRNYVMSSLSGGSHCFEIGLAWAHIDPNQFYEVQIQYCARNGVANIAPEVYAYSKSLCA